MSQEVDESCSCGHRHAEHSMFEACHGCSDCGDTTRGDEHRYQRCECRAYRAVDRDEKIAG